MTPFHDPVLSEFRSALAGLYGERLSRVVLFDPIDDFGTEAARLAAVETELLFTTGAIINAMPLKAGTDAHRTPSWRRCAATGSICEAGLLGSRPS